MTNKVSCDEMSNMDMIVEFLRLQLEVTKEDIEPLRQARWSETKLVWAMTWQEKAECISSSHYHGIVPSS